MNATNLLLILLSFLCFSSIGNSQTKPPLSADEWVEKLANPNDKKNETFYHIINLLADVDPEKSWAFVEQLEKHSKNENDYYFIRLNCLKAYSIVYNRKKEIEDKELFEKYGHWMTDAMNLSYELNDDYLTAFVSGRYGIDMNYLGRYEPAIMYLLNSAELYDKLNETPVYAYNNITLIGLLWYVREYEACIKYGLKTINYLETADYIDEKDKGGYIIHTYNTIALAYQRQQQYDSAFVYYQKGLDIEKKVNMPVWVGIISGNIGQIHFAKEKYDTALPLFELDYKNSLEVGEYDNAANSLQWAARTNLKLGHKELALEQIRNAFKTWHKTPRLSYGVNLYRTASEIFTSLGLKDSVIYYSNYYNKLNDSLEKSIYQSSISISKLRLNDEQNKFSLMNLEREKQEQIRQRNYIIFTIVLAAVFVLLFLLRKFQISNFQKELALKEKTLIEQDMVTAKKQLNMFTSNLIQKTNLIEKLEHQLKTKTITADDQLIISELSQQTLLTDDDWDNFKEMFEKAFPLFFIRLKNTAIDITMAEQRMAALTRLQLTTKQMASILGISVDSVHKTRQRLRRRFQLTSEDNLDEFISSI